MCKLAIQRWMMPPRCVSEQFAAIFTEDSAKILIFLSFSFMYFFLRLRFLNFLIFLGDWVRITRSISKRYSNLTNNLVKFESDLRISLLKWQSFEDATTSVMKWIKSTGREQQDVSLASSDANALYDHVIKLKVSTVYYSHCFMVN